MAVKTPEDYTEDTTKKQNDLYNQNINLSKEYYQPIKQYGSEPTGNTSDRLSYYEGNAPIYKSSYDDTLKNLMDQYINRKDYDPTAVNQSQLYQDTLARYKQLGSDAAENTIGKAAALTGGYGSSYATTAAAQANNDYMNQFADVAANMEQNAYNRWQDQGAALAQKIGTVKGMSDSEYNQFLNELSQWNSQRDYYYNKLQNEQAQSNWQNQFDYQKQQDTQAQNNWNDQFNYQKSQDDRNFNYTQQRDAADQNYRQQQLDYQKQQDAQTQSNWEKQNQQNQTAQEYQQWLDQQNAQSQAYEKNYNYARDTIYKELQSGAYGLGTPEGNDKLRNRIAAYAGTLGAEGVSKLLIELGINADDLASPDYWNGLFK
jgi:hypothetical protein